MPLIILVDNKSTVLHVLKALTFLANKEAQFYPEVTNESWSSRTISFWIIPKLGVALLQPCGVSSCSSFVISSINNQKNLKCDRFNSLKPYFPSMSKDFVLNLCYAAWHLETAVNKSLVFYLLQVFNHDCSLNESGGSPKSTGYDFSKYANGADIPPWSPRVSSRGSFSSSWSSADGEDPGWMSSSEGSGDEQPFVQTSSCHDNQSSGASVWCVDCKGDLLVTGCSDGTIEVWQWVILLCLSDLVHTITMQWSSPMA